MRRIFSIILTLALFTTLLYGCTTTETPATDTPDASTADESTETPAEDTEGMSYTVDVWVVGASQEENPLFDMTDGILQSFREETGVDLTFDYILGGDIATYEQKVLLSASSDTFPHMFWTTVTNMKDVPATGSVFEITEYIDAEWEANYPQSAWDEHYVATDGKKYGIPIKSELQGWYYNKRLFEENGLEIPTTWEEFTNAVEVFTEAGIIPIAQPGTDTWSRWGYDLWFHRYGLLENIDAINAGTMNFSDWSIPVFEKVDELAKMGAYPENITTMNHTQARELFMGGQAAMMTIGSWATLDLAASQEADNIVFNWGPTFEDSEFEQNYGIKSTQWNMWLGSKVSEDEATLDVILQYLKFFGTDSGSKVIAAQGEIPAAIYNPAEGEVSPLLASSIVSFQDDAIPVTEMASNFDLSFANVYWNAITAVMTQTATPEEAAAQVDEVIATALGQ